MARPLMLVTDWPPSPWSGVGIAAARQAGALAALGVEVTVLVGGPRAAGRLAVPRGVRVLPLDEHRFPVASDRFDLVHLHSLALAELAFQLRQRYRVPLVYTAHGLLHLEQAHSSAAASWCALQRRVLRGCDRAVFLSLAERDAALALDPAIAPRAVVVPNGLPAATAAEPTFVGGAEHRARGDRSVVFAGRFAASKGLDLLAAFAPLLFADHPTTLVMAGGHGDREGTDAVMALCARHPSRCRLTGWLPGPLLQSLLSVASVVVVPSRYEPFGLVALEAMAAGAPVVAAAAGGLTEVVGEGSGGRLVESREPSRWAATLLELLGDDAARDSLARRGPPWVASRFSIETSARRLAQDAYAC